MEQPVDQELFTREIERALSSQNRCDEIPRGKVNNKRRRKRLAQGISRALYQVLETERQPLMQEIVSLQQEALNLREEAENERQWTESVRQESEALRADNEALRA